MRFLLPILIFCACGGDAGDAAFDLADWTGGDFQFYTVQVDDQCLDGALEALFMPEGPTNRHAFEDPIYLPGYEELPLSYDISLRDPFVGMPVTVTEGDGGMLEVRGSVMESVELGQVAYGDCVVTMSVDADLLPVAADQADGNATVSITDARGDDGRCPVFAVDPCAVALVIEAERL
jgi:hypothetical protein